MTPAARLSAAIECVDRILVGTSPEATLTNWGRASRYAGSGDRHAVRDLVFDALRCKRSYAALGGAETGRGLILGSLRAASLDPADVFTGLGHAPAVVGENEAGFAPQGTAALDCPDWLAPQLKASLADDFAPTMMALRHRAPVFLRVNTARADITMAQLSLMNDGIETLPHALSKTALEVTGGARKIQNSVAYLTGLVDLQDGSSQAVVDHLPLRDGMRVLDYCAGGGGKTLAMAAAARISLFAHDVAPNRMRDLPVRAARAGAVVKITDNPLKSVPYDLVLTDVPCSGSGSWRRDPMGKWALTPARLTELCAVQRQILETVAPMVAPGGSLAYATCSLLNAENMDQIHGFLAGHNGWAVQSHRSFTPLAGGDGFFIALLTRIE